jgi:hypothetical protein
MQKALFYKLKRISPFLLILISGIIDCRVQLISDYDPSTVEAIIQSFKEIDQFYTDILNTSPEERYFNNYSNSYNAIESNLRVLVLRDSVQQLNTESTQMAQNILNLWLKYKNDHKENNSLKDALIILHRDRFFQMFSAMLVAENSKPKSNK